MERRRVCGVVAGWPGVGVGGVVWVHIHKQMVWFGVVCGVEWVHKRDAGGVVWVHKHGVGGVVWVHKQLVWCVVWCGCTSREVDERPNQI